MKRFFVSLLATIMVCSLFTISGFAAPETEVPETTVPEVSSPERIPDENPPLDDIPDENVPLAPQTGYNVGVVALISVAAASGAAAIVFGKKAFQH